MPKVCCQWPIRCCWDRRNRRSRHANWCVKPTWCWPWAPNSEKRTTTRCSMAAVAAAARLFAWTSMRTNWRATLPPHAPCSATAQMRWSVCAGPCSRPRRGPRQPHQATPPPGHAPAGEASAWGACRVHAVRAQLESAWDLPFKAQRHYLETVLAELPDALFAGDSTQPVYQGNLAIDMPGPRRWFNSSTGYGTLGYGLPAAIGAQLAAPDRPVVCLIGDGGLQFTLPELASAVEAGLAPIILLWNNGGYEEIRRYMRQRDIRPLSVELYTPGFQLLARGFGCDACRADDAAALRRALRQARSGTRDRPVLIETSQAHWHAHAYAADRQTATTPPGPLHGDTDA